MSHDGMKPDQSPAYWLESFVGGRWRNIGCVFRAGIDAPDELKGRVIFYRPLKRWEDSYMRRDQTIGFDLAVYDYLKFKTDVDFVVTYAEDSEKMNIATMGDFSFSRNYGQGIQMRAKIADTVGTFDNRKPLKYPNAVPHIKVDCEKPMEGLPRSETDAKGSDGLDQPVLF